MKNYFVTAMLAIFASGALAQERCPTFGDFSADKVLPTRKPNPKLQTCLDIIRNEGSQCESVCNSANQNAGTTIGAAAGTVTDGSGVSTANSQGQAANGAVNSMLQNIQSSCGPADTDCENNCADAETTAKQLAEQSKGQKYQKNLALAERLLEACTQINHADSDAQNGLQYSIRTAGTQAQYQSLVTNSSPSTNPITVATSTSAAATDPDCGFFCRNGDWMAAGGIGALAAGLATYFIVKDNSKSDNPSPSPTPSPTSGFETTSVDCTQVANLTNSACYSIMVQGCTTNENGTNCQIFADSYCGLGNGTDPGQGVVPQTTGAGSGTAYCTSVEGWRYCQTAGRTQCPSCTQQSTLQNPVCVSNPAICVGQYTSTQLSSLQTQCPGDPYFTNSTTTVATSSTTTSAVASTTRAPTSAAVGGQSSLLKPYQGISSEVSSNVDQSLFEKTSTAAKIWCDAVICNQGT